MVAGSALAPFAAVGSAVRRARGARPSGMVLWGSVTPFKRYDEWSDLAERLGGSVLVRFSGALWKEHQWPNVLGCALRFTHASEPSVEPMAGDQDLLFATVRVPATKLFAPLTTHIDDYLSNAYFGVSPFTDPELGRIKLRLVIDPLAREPVRLRLEGRNAAPKSAYHTIAEIELVARVGLDQEQLGFDPHRTGRALSPAGFLHALR
jgi:hypothetical protein